MTSTLALWTAHFCVHTCIVKKYVSIINTINYTLHIIQIIFEISYRGRQLPFRGETIQLSTGGQFYCLMPDRKLCRNRARYYKQEANLSPAGHVKTVWKMSSEGRFGRFSDAEMEKMMEIKWTKSEFIVDMWSVLDIFANLTY